MTRQQGTGENSFALSIYVRVLLAVGLLGLEPLNTTGFGRGRVANLDLDCVAFSSLVRGQGYSNAKTKVFMIFGDGPQQRVAAV